MFIQQDLTLTIYLNKNGADKLSSRGILNNLNSTKGALLRMNRSIQAEGAYGTIKWNRTYARAKRRGLKSINFEISMKSFLH